MRYMAYINIIVLIAIVFGCEQPRTRRVSNTTVTSSSTGTDSETEISETSSSTTEITTSNTTSPFTSTDFSTNSEITHCQWSEDGMNNFPLTHTIIGDFAICLSSANNDKIYFQIKSPVYDSPICFFPTTNEDSSSTYIGDPVCLNATSSTSIYPIQLYKNRSGYSHYNITGVMVMKDSYYYFNSPFETQMLIPDAYLYCMNHLANTQYYYGYSDNSYCEAFDQAQQYMYHQF